MVFVCRLEAMDILSSLSLLIARGALTQNVLEAPMERATGARTAKALRRAMEGIVARFTGVVCQVMERIVVLASDEKWSCREPR